MKKTLLIISALFIGILAYSQNLSVLAWTNGDLALQHSYELKLVDAIKALPEVASVDTVSVQADWQAYETTGFDDYDVVIIFESGSSSASQYYGTLEYPKPLVTFEPWVLHKDGWAWYTQADGFFTAGGLELDYRVDERYIEVIESPDHLVFANLNLSQGQEIALSNGGDTLDNSENDGDCYGVGLDMAIDDIANNATLLAHCKFAQTNDDVFDATGNMWAIEENSTTPRIFLYAQHAADLEYQTPELLTLAQNATLWVAGLDDHLVGIKEVSAQNDLRVYINPSSELVLRGIENISSVSVYNIAGQVVISQNSKRETINVSELNRGIYIVSATDLSGNIFTAKVIK